MNNPIIMHINYGEKRGGVYGRNTLDDIMKMAADLGFSGIEFRGEVPEEYSELSFKDFVAKIAEGKKKYGLTDILFGIGVNKSGSRDKAEREESIKGAIEQAKIVRELCGTTMCNTFAGSLRCPVELIPGSKHEFQGSAAAVEDDWKYISESYKKVGEELVKIGVKFAFETHMNYIHDLPHASKKLVDLIDCPNIGINMDYGNTVYFPEFPTVEATIDLYGDKLFYTHLKNSIKIAGVERNVPTSLDGGMIDHWAYIRKLKETGFKGPIGIEAPRPGDRRWFAKCDIKYVKNIIAEL